MLTSGNNINHNLALTSAKAPQSPWVVITSATMAITSANTNVLSGNNISHCGSNISHKKKKKKKVAITTATMAITSAIIYNFATKWQ